MKQLKNIVVFGEAQISGANIFAGEGFRLRSLVVTGVLFALSILSFAVTLQAQQVGDMYPKCKFWALNDYPDQLEFNKKNLAAFQCNEVFRTYKMTGKVHCQLTREGLSGFVSPFESYAFSAPTTDTLVDSFLEYAENNPRDWDKNIYSVLWKFTHSFKCNP